MPDLVRKEVFESCRTVVIKIGSNVLTRDDDQLDADRIAVLSEQIDRLKASGRQVIIVSSGAIAAGIGALGMQQKPAALPDLQACAAAGQPLLMQTWGDCLGRHRHRVAQILVTANDFRNRRRYLNIRNTIRTLFSQNIVPIVNENDTVSIQEIALGDNDQVATLVGGLVPEPLVVILSGVAGLYDGPPCASGSRIVPLVEKPDDSLLNLVSDDMSTRGRGGMAAKLRAILNATSTGESVILADGTDDTVLDSIAQGRSTGTLFLAAGGVVPAWKRWIGYATQPEGTLTLDDGACRAVIGAGRSLLAVGIQSVAGEFSQGASVELSRPTGAVIARGLVNYSADQIRRIAGHRKDKLTELLGHVPYGEVIHRDNLIVTDASPQNTKH